MAAAQATRTVTLTWVASTSSSVTGYSILSSASPTGPFSQIACTGTVPGSTCVSGSTSSTVTYNDTQTVGNTVSYQVIAVGPACTPTTPVGTACGQSPPSNTATTTVPPKPAAIATIVVTVQ